MSAYIRINKLFERLPEPERDLKAVQVYFDEYKTDKFNKKNLNVHILCLALVHKDNTQKMLSYKEFSKYSTLPMCEWLIIPINNKLMKVYIKAERVNYESTSLPSACETSYYHNCIVKICQDQTKLKELVKNMLDVISEINKTNENANANEINDDDIDPDIF